jgi:SAM-dependent methyltransferase
MHALLRAAFHIFTARDRVSRVAIVVDPDSGLDPDAIVILLHPWRAWLHITDVLVAPKEPTADWLERTINGAQALLVISEQPEFCSDFESIADQVGLLFVRSDYVTDTERSTALMQEVSHHHFELGGFNEWNGGHGTYSTFVLQHMSTANCIMQFPQYMIDDLRSRRVEYGRPLDALDIGCGALSRLRWGALQGLCHVTGVDPLLAVYELVLAYHGLDLLPSIKVDRAITAGAEALHQYVAKESIDFAYCCNALDHVENPSVVIERIADAMRPEALFALEFFTREGSRQEWQQLHQFDLFLDTSGSELMCQWRDGRVHKLVPQGAQLMLERVIHATDDHTSVVLRRMRSAG